MCVCLCYATQCTQRASSFTEALPGLTGGVASLVGDTGRGAEGDAFLIGVGLLRKLLPRRTSVTGGGFGSLSALRPAMVLASKCFSSSCSCCVCDLAEGGE
jgi:hypothetical protein